MHALTEPQSVSGEEGVDPMELVRMAEDYMSHVPEEEWDRLPKDLCENLDHYVYGFPKRSRRRRVDGRPNPATPPVSSTC